MQNSNTFSEGDATQEFSLSDTQWYKYFRLEFYKVSNIDEVAAKEFAFQGYAIHNLDNCTLNGMQEEYLYLGAFMPDYSLRVRTCCRESDSRLPGLSPPNEKDHCPGKRPGGGVLP